MKDILGREVPDSAPAFVVSQHDDERLVRLVARADDVLNREGFLYSSLYRLATSAKPGEYPTVSEKSRDLIMRGRECTVARSGVRIPHPDTFCLRRTCSYTPCEIYPLSEADASFFRPAIDAIERFYARQHVPHCNMRDWH